MNCGEQIIGAYSISDGVSCCMDTKISKAKILEEMPGVEIVEQNIQADHLHMVMIIPPKYSVSDVIGRIKGRSAGKLRKKFKWLEKVYWKENIVWSPGYFVSTIGLNEQETPAP